MGLLLRNMFVGQRNRNKHQRLLFKMRMSFKKHLEKTIFRFQEFPCSRPSPLEEELHYLPGFKKVIYISFKREFINRISGKRTPNEKSSRLSEKLSHGKNIKINSGRYSQRNIE